MKSRLFISLVLMLLVKVSVAAPSKNASQEIKAYMNSPTKCSVKHGDKAAKVAFERYHDWSRADALRIKPPKNAFRDAGQAFEYLYKSGCKDALIIYRFANILRLKKRYSESLDMMKSGLLGMQQNYPQYLTRQYVFMADAAEKMGDFKQAVNYYEKALKEKNNDSSFHINYANALSRAGMFKQSEEHIKKALVLGVSQYGKGVINNIRKQSIRLKNSDHK